MAHYLALFINNINKIICIEHAYHLVLSESFCTSVSHALYSEFVEICPYYVLWLYFEGTPQGVIVHPVVRWMDGWIKSKELSSYFDSNIVSEVFRTTTASFGVFQCSQ